MSPLSRRIFGATVLGLLLLLLGCEALRGPLRKPTDQEEKSEIPSGEVLRPSSRDSSISQGEREEAGAGLVLMLGFLWPDDPAAVGFERAFRFALNHSGYHGSFTVVRPGSPFETAAACDSLGKADGPLLIVFAGDEGLAAAAAFRTVACQLPLLKITADQRSYAEVGPRIFEFLPSGHKQADEMGWFAAKDLGLATAMILAPDDAKGRAHAEGFRDSMTRENGTIEAKQFYPTFATNVRDEITGLFGNEERKARGAPPLQGVLTEEERTTMFGNPLGGEVLFGRGDSDSLSQFDSAESEGLFFVVVPERVEAYASQLPRLPEGTVLLGNSSWLNEDALARYPSLTEGMYLVAPLLPQGDDTAGLLLSYQESAGSPADEWEFLGLDAGEFTGLVMSRHPRTRKDVVHVLSSMPPFSGAAVEVDFSEGNENRAARIFQYEYGEFHEVR